MTRSLRPQRPRQEGEEGREYLGAPRNRPSPRGETRPGFGLGYESASFLGRGMPWNTGGVAVREGELLIPW